MKIISWFFLLCLLSSSLAAADYDLLDTMLQKYTHRVTVAGIKLVGVDYSALKKDERYARLISSFAETKPEELTTEAEKLAFWLNAYNLFTLNVGVANYPLTSVKDAGDVYHPVWQQPLARIGEKVYSLDDLKLLLRQFKEPLVHTALAGASLSSPDLRREAYRPDTLKEQLMDQLQQYLANPDKGYNLNREEKILYLSSVFTWDAEDFKKSGGLLNFLEKYIPAEDKEFLNNNRCRIKYFDYNWSLNIWERK